MKFDYRNLLLVVVSILITLLIIEGGLRLVLRERPDLITRHTQDREFLTKFKYWKYWHYPNNQVNHQSDCYQATYATNSLGFKYKEIDPNKPIIAMVGDSYVEGYGASNNETLSHYLDSLSGGKYQFVPFGASGGFGTAHELAMYESFVRYFKPESVLLFFLNYNDFYDNINARKDGLVDNEGNLLTRKAGSLEEVVSEINALRQPESLETDVSIYTLALAHRGLRFLGNIIQYSRNVNGNFKNAIAEIYGESPKDFVQESYELTEKLLLNFKKSTHRDSTNLVIVNFADPFQIDDNWLEVMSKKIGQPLDPETPNTFIKEMCQQSDVEYISLYPSAKAEILQKQMKFPYFSHDCDNHLTAAGNLWVAEVVYQHLREKSIIAN